MSAVARSSLFLVLLLAVVLQVALFPLLRRRRRGAEPRPARRGRRRDRPWTPVRRGRSASRRASCSTSPRPPTTWPAAGRSPSWWSLPRRQGAADAVAARVGTLVPWPPLVRRHLDLRAERCVLATALPAGEMVQVIAIASLWDVVMAPLLLPVLMRLFRTRPRHSRVLNESTHGCRPDPSARIAQEPPAPDRGAGTRARVVPDPVRAALVHAGAHRGQLPGPGCGTVRARRRGSAAPRSDRRRHGSSAGRQPQQAGWSASTAPCCAR